MLSTKKHVEERWDLEFGSDSTEKFQIPPLRSVMFAVVIFATTATVRLLSYWGEWPHFSYFPFLGLAHSRLFPEIFCVAFSFPFFFLIGLSVSLGFMLMRGFCTEMKTLPNTIFHCLCVPRPCPCIRPPEATNWLCDIHLLGGTDTLKITKIANLTNPQCKNVVTNSRTP